MRASVPIALGIVFAVATLAIVWVLARPLALTFIALTLAESLRPLVSYLGRHLSRTLAIVTIYFGLLLLVAAAIFFIGPVLAAQARELLDRAPDLIAKVQHVVARWTGSTGIELGDTLRSVVASGSDWLLAVPVAFGRGILEALVVVFLSLYWLIESPALWPFLASLVPPGRRAGSTRVVVDVGRAIGGYFRAVAINAAVMGALAAVALAIAGIQYPLVLGAVTAVGELVPYVGPLVAGTIAAGAGLLQSPGHAIAAALIFVALEQVEGHLLTPTIMRSQTHVSATLVIVALLAGGSVGGLVGVLAAVPLAAAARTLAVEVVAPAVRGARERRVTEA